MATVYPPTTTLPRATAPEPIPPVYFNDWLVIGSALSSSTAMAIAALKLTGRVSLNKSLCICIVTSIVLGILGIVLKDQQTDFKSLRKLLVRPPIFDTKLYPGEDVYEPLIVPTSGGNEIKVIRLINRGLDCFMNATLQVIMHDHLLRDALCRKFKGAQNPTPAMNAFCRVIDFFNEGKTVSTYNLRQFMPDDHQFGQQDAHEFLVQLIGFLGLEESTNLFFPMTTTYSMVQKDPTGGESKTKQVQSKTHEFNSILEIPQSTEIVSGQDLVETYFSERKHDGGEFRCDEDQITYVPNTQLISFDSMPPRLVLVLKRFNERGKINTLVDMPEKLSVKEKVYFLKRVIIHHGSTRLSGHYTALLKLGEKWIDANDSRITETTDSTPARQNGYIYFYESE